MRQVQVVRPDGLLVRYVWAEHRDPERASALIPEALAARGEPTVELSRGDGRAEFVMGDAIEPNSGQVVVTLRTLVDVRARWDAWRAELIWAYGCALVTVARLVSEREIAWSAGCVSFGVRSRGAQWPPEYSEGRASCASEWRAWRSCAMKMFGISDALDAESGSLVD
jgi:hypothetical protein